MRHRNFCAEAGTPTTTTSSLKHLQAYWRDKESSRLSIGQKKTQAGLSTSIDDYDNYDDTQTTKP